MLAGVSEYHLARQNANKKRKRAQHDRSKKEKANSRKKRKLDVESTGNETHVEPNMIEEGSAVPNSEPTAMDLDTTDASDEPLPPPPPVFSHLTFGINEVTKRLEAQSTSLRPRTTVPPSEATPAAEHSSPPPLTHVFVCRADVDPPLLIAHLPELVAACNAPSPSTPPLPVFLVPFPQHAEQTLAETLGVRRVSVLALDVRPFLYIIHPMSLQH